MIALASNYSAWTIPSDEDTFNVDVIGKQWFWEFHYQEELTWEDDPSITYVNVDWSATDLTVDTRGSEATNVTVEIRRRKIRLCRRFSCGNGFDFRFLSGC